MQEIRKTADGSPTIYDDNFGESLHSAFGSITEGRHIFIEQGLMQILKTRKAISILEIGYGTGLNAALSYEAAKEHHINICYQGIEKYPPSAKIQAQFNAELPSNIQSTANLLSEIEWNKTTPLSEFFKIKKLHQDFLEHLPNQQFDLIYFDPFSPEKHPEAWDAAFLQRISENHMKAGAALLTYSSKGVVKQGLRAAGLIVQRLDGPPGKRHILRAKKI
ncbi:MAG: tRNA (5-methylaminomethyl-2-thiouridine)(34)-methyltransferase MnmD [Bacteroidales bacterium]|jgi:tRNA U34 5-methylaminomethyl-2-thiouridine-forming methyltransferase MnmC|nr:tRNA (5-methylaminomethyl-2-thiouridine)(34)-methyltransferase MnmD [Bacteroidales bacterium]